MNEKLSPETRCPHCGVTFQRVRDVDGHIASLRAPPAAPDAAMVEALEGLVLVLDVIYETERYHVAAATPLLFPIR